MHATAYHQDAKEELQGRVPVKKRWTELESSNLAMYEAKLILNGFDGNINEELVHWMEKSRSLEAIKSRRKGALHKNLVKDYMKSLTETTTDKDDGPTGLMVDLPPSQESPKFDDPHLNRDSDNQDYVQEPVLATNPDNILDDGFFNLDQSTEV